MSSPRIENKPRGTTTESGRTRMSSGPSAGLVAGASTAPLIETIWVEAALDIRWTSSVLMPAAASRFAAWRDEPERKPDGEVASSGAGSSPMGETASQPGNVGGGARKLRGIARRYVSGGKGRAPQVRRAG